MQLNLMEDFDDQSKPPDGNRTLVSYGIQNEESDFRAHVAYKAAHVYVFPTASARSLVAQADHYGFRMCDVRTENIITGRGYLVPLSYIKGIQTIPIPRDIYDRLRIDEHMLTSNKGKWATAIVAAMLKRDLIPLPVRLNHADTKALQISGTDIVINADLHLQVKCDYKAGDVRFGGTGNLFIQTEECNPFQRY